MAGGCFGADGSASQADPAGVSMVLWALCRSVLAVGWLSDENKISASWCVLVVEAASSKEHFPVPAGAGCF